eukprot:5797622-Alexandrium_andersonii.AAC.1
MPALPTASLGGRGLGWCGLCQLGPPDLRSANVLWRFLAPSSGEDPDCPVDSGRGAATPPPE